MGNTIVNKLQEKETQAYKEQEEICKNLYGVNVTVDNRPAIYNESLKDYMCPAYWDTIYCWPDTKANTTIEVGCPSYTLGFITKNNASRYCYPNGTWFSKDHNRSWSNYSSCLQGDTANILTEVQEVYISNKMQETLPIIKVMSQTGYTVSLFSLIIAFSIMYLIKKLHCARNILHMNLFASFIFRAFIWILKYILFKDGLGTDDDFINYGGQHYFNINVETNNYKCKLLTSFAQYFTAANYSWILVEGLYLSNLIFRALFADSGKNVVHYIILGWGLPCFVVIPWIIARLFLEDVYCWTSQENKVVFLIIAIPTMLSIIINFVLFVIISIVLYSKLRSLINEDSRRYQKWAKSTLVLVPLFGVHYFLLLGFYLARNIDETVEVIWLIADRLFGSFQGFFVAVLYCFLNGEVKTEIKPYIQLVLTYVATNRYLKYCLPHREKYLRSAVGRTSVCTTMSCSSLYTNGVMHHRNSKSKITDGVSKLKPSSTGCDKSKDHICINEIRNSRKNPNSLKSLEDPTINSGKTVETSLMHEPPIPIPEMIVEEEISMLPKTE